MPSTRIQLRRVDVSEQAALAAALRPYLAELAEFEPELEKAESLDYPYLPLYWSESGREAYWVTLDGDPIGFALSNQQVHQATSAWSVSEFAIDVAWRRKGFGFDGACALLSRHDGPWEVPVLAANTSALKFWRRVLGRCAPGRFEELPDGAVPGWDGTVFVVSARAVR
jgi:predicted acetyltransferase